MQALLDVVRRHLEAFVDQRDAIALLVPCRDEETPVVLKQLEGVDEASTAAMFWIFTDAFVDAGSYAEAIVQAFAVKHAAVRAGMPALGLTPWPPLPERLRDGTRSAVRRLRETMVFARSLLPDPQGMVAVIGLVPLEIHDPVAWAALMAAVLAHDYPQPWCHHLRIVVRGDADEGPMATQLQGIRHLAWFRPDLGPEAMHRALDVQAHDRSLPMPQRMQGLFLSAEIDYAHGRFDTALQKFALLLKYHMGLRDPLMTALVLNAIGETHRREGRDEQAGHCFERAFVPASRAAGPPLPLMLNIVVNLGSLRSEQARWEEAQAYWDSAQQLATAQRDAGTKLRALEELGHCHAMLGDPAAARQCWEAGVTVAGALGIDDARDRLAARLVGGTVS